MTKQEFLDLCHEEFTKRGFVKKNKRYFMQGNGILCRIYLQKSMSEAYYVNLDFFIGHYDDFRLIRNSNNDFDYAKRLCVWSKDTYKGKHFWGALIVYELYTAEEIRTYFDIALTEHFMSVILEGKEALRKEMMEDKRGISPEEIENILMKFQENR